MEFNWINNDYAIVIFMVWQPYHPRLGVPRTIARSTSSPPSPDRVQQPVQPVRGPVTTVSGSFGVSNADLAGLSAELLASDDAVRARRRRGTPLPQPPAPALPPPPSPPYPPPSPGVIWRRPAALCFM